MNGNNCEKKKITVCNQVMNETLKKKQLHHKQGPSL